MREEKRWLRHCKWLKPFFLAAKVICAPGVIKAEQNTYSTKHNIPRLEPQNIRESNLDFTAHFGEINPDMLYICRRGRREPMKKIVKSSIFCEKTSKFLRFLSFKP